MLDSPLANPLIMFVICVSRSVLDVDAGRRLPYKCTLRHRPSSVVEWFLWNLRSTPMRLQRILSGFSLSVLTPKHLKLFAFAKIFTSFFNVFFCNFQLFQN